MSDPKLAESHQNLVAMPSFQLAMDFAMLQLVYQGTVSAEYVRGAQDFAKILMTLADVPIIKRAFPDVNLKQT